MDTGFEAYSIFKIIEVISDAYIDTLELPCVSPIAAA
jgi:hypothetical protein